MELFQNLVNENIFQTRLDLEWAGTVGIDRHVFAGNTIISNIP